MKLLAATFTLPLILSSCGTTRVEDKQIQIQSSRMRDRMIEDDPFDLTRPDRTITYVYLIADKTGKLVYLGENKGYNTSGKNNEGIWIDMKNPRTEESRPVYVVNNVIISSFKLDQ